MHNDTASTDFVLQASERLDTLHASLQTFETAQQTSYVCAHSLQSVCGGIYGDPWRQQSLLSIYWAQYLCRAV